MDVLDKFFKKFSYKFPKGYPDINDEQDMLMLEGILEKIGIDLKETALTPKELSKDATFPGGVKTPRIEILIDKIKKGEELELNDGSKFIVDNREEVLTQLKGKTSISKAINLIDKEGNKITTSNLKKSADFGGGGGMRGGSDLTAKAESAQCIVNAIRYSLGNDITASDVTLEAIKSSKNKIQVDQFEGGVEILQDPKWKQSSVNIANALASQYSGPFIQNRGSEWVKNLEKSVKPLLKGVGISDINKWSPADIWMVAPSEMNITWPSTLNEINSLLLKKYEEGTIIGVSLKKASDGATLKLFNSPSSEKTTYEFKGIDPRPNATKSFVYFGDNGSIEFRTFGGLGSFQGEILGKKAAGGKIGYGIIKKALSDNGISLPDQKQIRNEVVNNDPKFKEKFQKLWNATPGLDANNFESQFTRRGRSANQNLVYRISKYLSLSVVNAINNANNPSKIITDIINYASSSTAQSAIFVKAS